MGCAEVWSSSIEGYFLRRNVPDLLKEFVLIIIGSGANLFFSQILEQERKSLARTQTSISLGSELVVGIANGANIIYARKVVTV